MFCCTIAALSTTSGCILMSEKNVNVTGSSCPDTCCGDASIQEPFFQRGNNFVLQIYQMNMWTIPNTLFTLLLHLSWLASSTCTVHWQVDVAPLLVLTVMSQLWTTAFQKPANGMLNSSNFQAPSEIEMFITNKLIIFKRYNICIDSKTRVLVNIYILMF